MKIPQGPNEFNNLLMVFLAIMQVLTVIIVFAEHFHQVFYIQRITAPVTLGITLGLLLSFAFNKLFTNGK